MTGAEERLYVGADLHGNNVVLSVLDAAGAKVWERRVKARLDTVLRALDPIRDRVAAVGVESTYNWYWLVDGLLERELPAMLANPSRLNPYKGLKATDDFADARWLAELTRLGAFPASYICPEPLRGMRDLLRRRLLLVEMRTGLLNSLGALRARHGLDQGMEAGRWTKAQAEIMTDQADRLGEAILKAEKLVLEAVRPTPDLRRIMTVPGLGQVLGMTVLLESGDFTRFAGAGHYASYARTVKSTRTSNGKVKGSNNARNGNPHLARAFAEAAHHASRHYPRIAKWFAGKARRRPKPVAWKALASKLAKGTWHVMNGEDFSMERLFG